MLRLAEHLGVKRKDIYCVGDNQNDIPMLSVSAVPFAPANCADAVRYFSPVIVKSSDDHCIADIIRILRLLHHEQRRYARYEEGRLEL